jgi:hypothetical protein
MVIGLSGYIAYDKLLNKSEKQENNSETSNKKEENNLEVDDDISWVDYLLEQEFVSASLSVCRIDDKYVYYKDQDSGPNPGVIRNINKDELKEILNTINKSERNDNPFGEIVKGYGYAAPACTEEISYVYIHEGKEYTFRLANATIIVTEDEDFIKNLNNHVNEYTNYAINKDSSNYYNSVKDMMKDYIKY